MNDNDVEVIYENILSLPESLVKERASSNIINTPCIITTKVISSPKVSTESILSTTSTDSTHSAPTVTIEMAHKIKLDNVYIKQYYENLEKSCDINFPSKETEENQFISPSTFNTRKRKLGTLQHGADSHSEIRTKRKSINPRSINLENNTTKKYLSEDWETLTTIMNLIRCYDEGLLKYLENHANVVLDNYSNFINEKEKVMIQTFFSMDTDCKCLYEQFYREKYKGHRITDYQYDATIMKSISVLTESNFLLTDTVNFELIIVLDMLELPEVKKLCESLGIKCTGRRKKDYIQEILCHSQLQKSMLNRMSSNDLLNIALNIMGPCFILCPKLYGLFQRISFLYYLKCNEKEVFKIHSQFAETSKSVYPDYIIDRTARIFRCRDELLSFQIAVELWMKFSERLEARQWIQANIYLCTIRNNWSELTKCSGISAPPLPLCLREYTSGSVYTYALYKGVEILKRYNQEQAIKDITLLLEKRTYLPYLVGQWYEQIINIYQTSGQIEKVIEIIDCAVKDSDRDLQVKYVVSCCIAEILKKKKGVSIEARSILQCVPVISTLKCKEASVIKTVIYGKSGCEQLYVKKDENGDKKLYSSVEDLVKDYYCPLLFRNGNHAGNNIISSLFGVLFWDMIYECPVPCAFINLNQSKPLDLMTGEFYRNRQASFDKKYFEMTTWNPDEINFWVKEIYTKQKDKKSIVKWKLFQDSDYILDIINCIGWEVLLKICKRLAENYSFACNGFPKFFTWTPGQTHKYRFVVVQQPKVKLDTNQRMWQDFLLEVNAKVEICIIRIQQSQVTKFSVDSEEETCANTKESDQDDIVEIILPNTSNHIL